MKKFFITFPGIALLIGSIIMAIFSLLGLGALGILLPAMGFYLNFLSVLMVLASIVLFIAAIYKVGVGDDCELNQLTKYLKNGILSSDD